MARQIAGAIGFAVTAERIDGYVVFCIITRFLNEARIRLKVWTCLVRLGHYLVATIDLPLTLRRVPAGTEMVAFVDSAHGNLAGGRSQGGFFCCFPGSGALCWSSSAPASPSESSTAGELHQAVRCIKAVTGLRVYLRELNMAPARPTATYSDFQVMLDVTSCARISKEPMWICTRLAMARHYKASEAGEFLHIPGLENPADMLTKPLPAPQFAVHRAHALGLLPSDQDRMPGCSPQS